MQCNVTYTQTLRHGQKMWHERHKQEIDTKFLLRKHVQNKHLRDTKEERMRVCKNDVRGTGSEASSLIRGCNDWIL